jgi:isoleucyl-tRNA synthetase
MRRTPEVIDVWFDSGAMPYAQWHYPFENQQEFRTHFPADYICEAVDQTRGWFYSLLAISTLLDLGPAYRHVIVNDLVLDAQGLKMSKSRGNIVDPWQVINVHGADAIRWYFVTVSQPWVPKRFDADAMSESVRRIFDTLANTYRFFAMYANLESWRPSAADPAPAGRSTMDRWILSRVTGLAAQVHGDLAGYDLTRAARAIGDFIVDDLSNWYVRCSRDRFYGRAGHANEADTRGAFATLRDVLVAVAKLMAPFVPFHADWLHRALRDDASVHLERFPVAAAGGAAPGTHDVALEAGMDAVRELVRLGRAAREKVRIRVRQPLRTLYAVTPDGTSLDADLVEVLKAELNIKDVRFPDRAEELLAWKAVPNFRVLGKRFGGRTQEAAARIRELPSDAIAAFRRGGSLSVAVAGETFELSADEVEIREEPRGELVVETEGGYTVAIDATLDEELRLEGLARELVNRIQRQRRESKLEVSDRIRLGIFGEPAITEAAARHRLSIMHETLAVDLVTGGEPAGSHDSLQSADLDGISAHIGLSRVHA